VYLLFPSFYYARNGDCCIMFYCRVNKWTGDMPQNVNYAIKSGYVQILLSSIDPASSIPVLPVMKGNLADLAKRIEGSVLMVIAQ